MAINYDMYLNRLREKRLADPAYSLYRQEITKTSEPIRDISRRMTSDLTRAGGSVGLRAQTLLSSQMNTQKIMSDQFAGVKNQILSRNEQIDDEIAKVRMQQQAEKDAHKDAVLKTGLQVGGAAIGAIAGSIIPGAGTMAGMSIGSALGQAAGSFVGGGGNMGTEYLDEAQLIQGVGDLTTGIASAVTLKDQKKLATDLGNSILEHKDDTGWLEGFQVAYLMGTDAVRAYIAEPKAVSGAQTPVDENGEAKTFTLTPESKTEAVKTPETPDPVGTGISVKEQVKEDAGVGGAPPPKREEVQGMISNDQKTLAFYADVNDRKSITDGIKAGEYEVKKNGNFSINSRGLVVFVNGAPKAVRDVTGAQVKAKLGDTIIVNADGSITVRSK